MDNKSITQVVSNPSQLYVAYQCGKMFEAGFKMDPVALATEATMLYSVCNHPYISLVGALWRYVPSVRSAVFRFL